MVQKIKSGAIDQTQAIQFSALTVTGDVTLGDSSTDIVTVNGKIGIGGANYGTAGQVLMSSGPSAAPAWSTISGVPAGTVVFHAANTAPTGFIKANGAAVSRTTYADLFAAIGTTFGVGNGTTTFNVPDLRGEFIRGWDDARAIDSGRVFGSFQADEFKSHTHTTPSGGGAAYGQPAGGSPASSSVTGATGGTETRPRNIALLACIKF